MKVYVRIECYDNVIVLQGEALLEREGNVIVRIGNNTITVSKEAVYIDKECRKAFNVEAKYTQLYNLVKEYLNTGMDKFTFREKVGEIIC